MGLKQLVIIFVALLFIAGYGIGASEKVSVFIEDYSLKNMQDPQLEKVHYANIQYCYWTGKNQRTLELIEKYELRYKIFKKLENLQFLKAKAYDSMANSKKAKEEFQKYIDDYPEGEKTDKAKQRIRELGTFY